MTCSTTTDCYPRIAAVSTFTDFPGSPRFGYDYASIESVCGISDFTLWASVLGGIFGGLGAFLACFSVSIIVATLIGVNCEFLKERGKYCCDMTPYYFEKAWRVTKYYGGWWCRKVSERREREKEEIAKRRAEIMMPTVIVKDMAPMKINIAQTKTLDDISILIE